MKLCALTEAPMDPHSPPPMQSTPPVRPGANDKRGCMIALIVGGIGVALSIAAVVGVVFVLPMLNPSSEAVLSKKLAAAPKLTEEMKPKLMEFAEDLISEISNGDMAAVNTFCDYEALAARVFEGVEAGGLTGIQLRQGFLSSIEKQGYFSEIADADLRPLRVIERDGFPAVTLRILPSSGGVNYIDLLIWQNEDAFKVIDMHTYLYGSLSSTDTRDMLAAVLADSDQQAFAKILGISGENVKELVAAVQTLNEKAKAGDQEGLVEAYRGFPVEVQKLRLPFMRYLTALQQLNSAGANEDHAAAYREAIQKAPTVFGTDATTDLLLVDELLLRESYDAAIETVNRVDETIGGDPYLHVLRGWIFFQKGQMADVMRCIALADQEEPELVAVVDLKLSYHAKTQDYAALVQELKDFKVRFGTRLGRAELSQEAQYEEFLKSDEFAAYEKQGE